MIIDRTAITGLSAYLRVDTDPPVVNLAPAAPVSARTDPLGPGRWREITAVQVLVAGELGDRLAAAEPYGAPLFSITVNKELFPGLFADPYRHRVHTIAGFDDFNRGEFENCRAMEVDGMPCVVSLGPGECRWRSRTYTLPDPSSFTAAYWDLATSRLDEGDPFRYGVVLDTWTAEQDPAADAPRRIDLAPAGRRASLPRSARVDDVTDVAHQAIEFIADVTADSYLVERHAPSAEPVGRPLLRSLNLLEPVPSVYDFASLDELLDNCSEFLVLDRAGAELSQIRATVMLAATLRHAERQDVAAGGYEYIELNVYTDAFTTLEARLRGEDLTRPPM